MTTLDDMLRAAAESLERRRSLRPLAEVVSTSRDAAPAPFFRESLVSRNGEMRIIAELKKSSPTTDFGGAERDAAAIATGYEEAGTAAISVLTEERYFSGSMDDLTTVSRAVSLPVLRKDFITDPYQVYDARACGASAVLLIAAALSGEQLKELVQLSVEIGITPFVEVTDESDLKKALGCNLDLLGINCRNLEDFSVDRGRIKRLLPMIPEEVLVVAESGVSSYEHIEQLKAMNVHAALVGTTLMLEPDPGTALKELLRRP